MPIVRVYVAPLVFAVALVLPGCNSARSILRRPNGNVCGGNLASSSSCFEGSNRNRVAWSAGQACQAQRAAASPWQSGVRESPAADGHKTAQQRLERSRELRATGRQTSSEHWQVPSADGQQATEPGTGERACTGSEPQQLDSNQVEQSQPPEPLRLICPPNGQQGPAAATPSRPLGEVHAPASKPPGGGEPVPGTIQQTSHVRPIGLLDRYGHAPDYSWIRGRLEHSAVRGGGWLVRYAPFDGDDRYGGSFLLDIDPRQRGLKPGDWVSVRGQLVQSAGESAWSKPTYRVQEISKLQ